MESHVHGLEPVGDIFSRFAGRIFRFPLGGALQSQFRRQIENDREIGPGCADDSAVDCFDHVARQPARGALVGAVNR